MGDALRNVVVLLASGSGLAWMWREGTRAKLAGQQALVRFGYFAGYQDHMEGRDPEPPCLVRQATSG